MQPDGRSLGARFNLQEEVDDVNDPEAMNDISSRGNLQKPNNPNIDLYANTPNTMAPIYMQTPSTHGVDYPCWLFVGANYDAVAVADFPRF